MGSKAFVREINPIGSDNFDEDNSVHQVSPAWVLTFVRWENRDTQRVKNISSTLVRTPLLVVENDCLQISVNVSKGTLTPSMDATLIMSDVNYEAAVAPGDFVFVNILNWEQDSRRVANAARANLPINGPEDGFKGIFKVQGVRRFLSVDPATGTKIILFKINGFAFTEFNNTIHFDPNLIDGPQKDNDSLFQSFISKDWANLVNGKGLFDVQNIIALLIQSLIGTGVSDEKILNQKAGLNTPNTVHFFIPSLVGTLLGVPRAKAAKDIYNYVFGIQNYASGSSATSLSQGMNPSGLYQKFNRFFYTKIPCPGDTLLRAEYWNQVKTWSILNQYTNSPINEMYTCFRVSPSDPHNRIMPTLIFRQIPFTTEDFKHKSLPTTKFLNIPRWKINMALVFDQDIGRDESARINFVQYFGQSSIGKEGTAFAAEIAQINYVYDIEDVKRSGLRPYIVTTQFDETTTIKTLYRSPGWAKILGDCLIGGHLKMNGTASCAGIVDPISVGDNLEMDGTVYHIEQISHSANVSVGDGRKTFRTSLKLSSGVDISSSSKGTKYAEMSGVEAYKLRETDYDNEAMLPGISEEQDTVYRPTDPRPTLKQINTADNPFPQPDTAIKKKRKNPKRKK